jgi:hypothetical protein
VRRDGLFLGRPWQGTGLTHGSDPSDPVGYKKPPGRTRFKKGRSGNPNGRPRRLQPNGDGQVLFWALEWPVTIKVNGKKKCVTAREAIVEVMLREAAKGDLKAMDCIRRLAKAQGDHNGDLYAYFGNGGVPNFPKEKA